MLIAGINHILSYGQSLSNGWEGWPAITTRPPTDAMMLGRSVRPIDEWLPRWRPVGGPEFHPLAATVQDIATGRLLDPAEIARLADPAPVLGETILEAAVHGLRAALPNDQQLLASACGVGGRSLEALSNGAEPDLFNRLRDCIALARTLAAPRPYNLAAILLLQGEHNAWAQDGATDDAATYAALLRQWHKDVAALSDGPPPQVFTHQTGGPYATETLSIAQAQLDVALHTPGWHMAAPSYPMPDKGGHLTADGYHRLGRYFARAMISVFVRNQPWRPLHPLAATGHSKWPSVTFHVPAPPLRWGKPFHGATPTDVPDRGFSVIDSRGPVPIERIDLAGPSAVTLKLARPPAGPSTLRYAAAGPTLGLGCLHDSDPLMNWTPAFTHPITQVD